ncbi:hypothetical protein BJX76DRAFT_330178 [Aspergillus varians]
MKVGILRLVRVPNPLKVLLHQQKKALRWLYFLGESDEAARRAFHFCNSCLHRIAPRKGLDLADITSTAARTQTLGSADYQRHWNEPGGASTLRPSQVTDSLERKDDLGLQELGEAHTSSSLGILPNSSVVFGADSDMSQLISHVTDANVQDLLLLAFGNNA